MAALMGDFLVPPSVLLQRTTDNSEAIVNGEGFALQGLGRSGARAIAP
ncbi:MAG: hypothetical protein ACO34J_05950 [Prochlorothrix sp.]